MDFEEKTAVVDAIIDEYLKPTPNEEDIKDLMEQLEIKYVNNGIANMSAVLNSVDFLESAAKSSD